MSHAVLIAWETPAAKEKKEKAPRLSEAVVNASSLRQRQTHRDRETERGRLCTVRVASRNRRRVAGSVHAERILSALVRNILTSAFFLPSPR